jgi:hypothetical protein
MSSMKKDDVVFELDENGYGGAVLTVEDLEEGKKLIGDRTFAEAALAYWRDKPVGYIGYDDGL